MPQLEKDPFNFLQEEKYKIHYSKSGWGIRFTQFLMDIKSIFQRLNPSYHQFQIHVLEISELKQEDYDRLIKFIKKSQEDELKQCIEIYWKYEKSIFGPSYLQMKFSEIKKEYNYINQLYNKFIVDLDMVYNIISRGQYQAIGAKEKSIIYNMILLLSHYKTNTKFVSPTFNKFVEDQLSEIRHDDDLYKSFEYEKKTNHKFYNIFD